MTSRFSIGKIQTTMNKTIWKFIFDDEKFSFKVSIRKKKNEHEKKHFYSPDYCSAFILMLDQNTALVLVFINEQRDWGLLAQGYSLDYGHWGWNPEPFGWGSKKGSWLLGLNNVCVSRCPEMEEVGVPNIFVPRNGFLKRVGNLFSNLWYFYSCFKHI